MPVQPGRHTPPDPEPRGATELRSAAPLGLPLPPPATEARYRAPRDGDRPALPGPVPLPLTLTLADVMRGQTARACHDPLDAAPVTDDAVRAAAGADARFAQTLTPVPTRVSRLAPATVQVDAPVAEYGTLLAVRVAPPATDPSAPARPDTVVLCTGMGEIVEADVTATTQFFYGAPALLAAIGHGVRHLGVGPQGARAAAAFLAWLAAAPPGDAGHTP
ncbi:MAG TPA: hypothetical protein VGD56_09910 [Gemmatirosa sp.]